MTEITNYWDVLLDDQLWIDARLSAERKRELQIASNELGISAKKFLKSSELNRVINQNGKSGTTRGLSR